MNSSSVKVGRLGLIGAAAIILPLALVRPSAAQTTFSNTASITIPDSGAAGTYPSPITVSGLSGTITGVTITLSNINHTFMDDLDILLVGPTGAKTLLLSDVFNSTNFSNVSLIISGTAANAAPDGSVTAVTAPTLFPTSTFSATGGTAGRPLLTGGTASFLPTDFTTGDVLATGPPVGPYVADLSVFTGLTPNGAYSLYVSDDAAGDAGSIAGGWSITITTSAVTVVPEPGTLTLALAGGVALIAPIVARRRRTGQKAAIA